MNGVFCWYCRVFRICLKSDAKRLTGLLLQTCMPLDPQSQTLLRRRQDLQRYRMLLYQAPMDSLEQDTILSGNT